MRKPPCCDNYRNGSYNYCPECGIALKRGEYVKQEPTVTIDPLSHKSGEERYSHPAYGQLSFSRRTSNKGGEVTLYGSTIRHQNTITMSVYRSDKFTDEFSEHYFAGNTPLIEVEMSQSQFTEAITAMNMGSGVPVTLKHVMGRVMPQCIDLTLRQKADKSLKSRFVKFAQRLNKTMERVEELTTKKGTLKVSEKEEIRKAYGAFITEIQSNLPFLKECIDENVDASIMQAKDEVESFWLNRIQSLGMEKMLEDVNNGKFKMVE